jgi:signal transduction histidine kinase
MIDVMQDPEGQDLFDLAKVQQTARRALNLADDVMRLARAEALDPQAFRAVDLAVLGIQAVEEAESLGRGRGVEVGFSSREAPGSAFVQGDAELLRRALINLLNNAVRHSPDRGRVSLELAGDGAAWELTVADQGQGIPPEQIPKLFTPYAASGDRRREGTGLGLIIVKTVVERHGGSLSVDTAAATGTRFRIRLARAGGSRPKNDS